MVRARNLITLAAAALLASWTLPARAETAMAWYIDLKRDAKYARIASVQGASVQQLQPFKRSAEALIARIDGWDGSEPRGSAGPCLFAAQDFLNAMNRSSAEARTAAIANGEPKRDACLAALQTR